MEWLPLPGSGIGLGLAVAPTVVRRIMSSIEKEPMFAIELIQSMRTGTFGEFVVMGSQYKDQAGDRHWYIALLTGPEPARIHHVIAGELPDELTVDERDAVIQAITLWERQPLSKPN
jgi:hypothetical protein